MITQSELLVKYITGQQVVVGVVGNSVGEGVGATVRGYAGTGWASQLHSHLQSKNATSQLINKSVSGYQTKTHLDLNTIAALAANVPKPQAVFIPLEINDYLSYLGILTGNATLTEYKQRLRTLVQQCIDNDMLPILVKENPILDGNLEYWKTNYVDELDVVKAEKSCPVFDTFTPMYNYPNWQTGLLVDTRHPNQTGHNFIAARYVNDLFNQRLVTAPIITQDGSIVTAQASAMDNREPIEYQWGYDGVGFPNSMSNGEYDFSGKAGQYYFRAGIKINELYYWSEAVQFTVEDFVSEAPPYLSGAPVYWGGFIAGSCTIPVADMPEEMIVDTTIAGKYDVVRTHTVDTQIRGSYDVIPVHSVDTTIRGIYDVTLVHTVDVTIKGVYDIIVPDPVEPSVSTIEFLMSLGAGEKLTIDCEKLTATVTKTDGSVINVLHMTKLELFELLAGVNFLQVTDTSGSRTLDLSVAWREKYL